jgi:hypothetical protein
LLGQLIGGAVGGGLGAKLGGGLGAGLRARGGGSEWSVPANATSKFPPSWGEGVPNKKGVGMRWQDPDNLGNGVRIDQGNPNSSQVSQQVDHAVVRYKGQVIGRDGTPIQGSIKQNPVDAHIPLSEYIKWKTWYSP